MPNADHVQERTDLAAAFRLAAKNDWHEAVANHFSLAVSNDGRQFLMNPRWRAFSRLKASDLMLLDADDPEAIKRADAPDPSAWCIHGAIHRAAPQAKCVLHVHSAYATAVASLANPDIPPIDQNTARYYKRIAIDRDYGGIADFEEEGARIVRALGNQKRLMMGNHGILVVAETVAEAYDDLYYLERACRNLVLAYSTGRPLSVLSHEIAEKTAQGWDDYKGSAFAHFEEAKRELDFTEPDYAH